jgi:bacillithiol biosynthesis deacetylase BshB1
MEKDNKIDILAFGSHPDDVELGCGGALFKLKKLGYRTGIIDLTEGELSSRGTMGQRIEESTQSAKILKVDTRQNLKIPDGNIQVTTKNRELIVKKIRQYRPILVFAPYPDDRHPDHIHASNLVTEGWFYAGVKKILKNIPTHRSFRIIYYMAKYEFIPSFVIDISNEFETKMKALQSYKSQFYNPKWPEEQTFISSQWFIESVEFRARHFGWIAGVKYGEPFWIKEPMAIDDPVPIFSRSIT